MALALNLNRNPSTVVGVLPPAFAMPNECAAVEPLLDPAVQLLVPLRGQPRDQQPPAVQARS